MNANRHRLAELELRKACIHEAGHAEVCRRFGGYGLASVWPNDSGLVGEEKAWRGQFRMHAQPGQVLMEGAVRQALGIIDPPKDWRTLVGLAGLVAETIADGYQSADHIGSEIEAMLELGDVSASDADLMGNSWSYIDVQRVLDMLSDRWGDVCKLADMLAERALERAADSDENRAGP